METSVPWIREARTILYWGDIDQRGYEIVDGLRRRLPRLSTILMDQPTYETYAEFGTYSDENGKLLKPRPRLVLDALTPEERAMYDKLSDPEWTRHRRFGRRGGRTMRPAHGCEGGEIRMSEVVP